VANILLKRCGKEKQRGGGDVGRGGGRRGGKEARDLFTLQRLEGKRTRRKGYQQQGKTQEPNAPSSCTNKGRRQSGQGESDGSRV